MIYHPVVVFISLAIVLILITLSLLKEVIRATGHPASKTWMLVLNFAIAPLFLAFLVIIFLRFISLYR